MQHSRSRIIFDGAVAGILGALVVAVWFLIFDAARGRPLETPAMLAATLLHGSGQAGLSIAQLVTEYTVLHLVAFIAVGILGALLLESAENEPTMFISLLVFLGAFEVFFIAVVMFLGPAVMSTLTWWGIVAGNLMATGAMLYYFLSRHPALAKNLLGRWTSISEEGVAAGLIGATIVALWFLACDTAMGDAFRTPMLLGGAIFNGAAPATAAAAPLIAGYTVLHFLAFIVFGVAFAVLMAGTDREPLLALGVLVVFAIFEVFFFGWVTLIDSSLLEALGWWRIIAGNVLALAGMAAFEIRHHRGLVLRLEERWAALESEGDEAATHSPRASR